MQARMTEIDRKLPLTGIDNFRDYGGYATASGRTIRRGLLYRSANWREPTAEDFAAIASLGLSHVVDLRRKSEREGNPARRPDRFGAEIIDNDLLEEVEDAYMHVLKTGDLSPASMQAHLIEFNRRAPFEPRHIDLFARYFRALGDGNGAILIHCAAGKDRTGLLAALTHHLAGVAEAEIVADYMLTNDEARFAVRTPIYADWIEQATGRRPSTEFVRACMGVEAENIEAAFDAIKARYGSIDAYIEQALGVDAAMKARIEARLFES